jgi:hypothetical protein
MFQGGVAITKITAGDYPGRRIKNIIHEADKILMITAASYYPTIDGC